MTENSSCRGLYLAARKRLQESGIDFPENDAALLCEKFLGLDRAGLVMRGEKIPSPAEREAFLLALDERCAHRPLQYILGEWEFMGLRLYVGEGVLCPREDTAVLVHAAASYLKNTGSPEGLDLCAGSGAVALGLCSLLPSARVKCLELSDEALFYLEKNISRFPGFAVSAEKADVLRSPDRTLYPPRSLDFIVSNPPYVKSGEIAALSPEVQKEPRAALDGGGDGLRFYRAIIDAWSYALKPGGLIAFETGDTQLADVKALLLSRGFSSIRGFKDLSGLDRCVSAIADF